MRIKNKKIKHSSANENFVKLDMTFDQALKKALNTPLPKKKIKKGK